MSTKQRHTLNTPDNAENNHRLPFGDKLRTQENMDKQESQTSSYESWENTPFTIVCHNNQWFIAMGKYVVTNKYPSKQEAIDEIKNKDWELMVTIAMATIDIMQKPEIKHFIDTLKGEAKKHQGFIDTKKEV